MGHGDATGGMRHPPVYVYPCGCVERDRRGGPLERDCGDPGCYRRTRPANVVVLNRAMRRQQGRR
jgi:hypothetical protein